MNNNMLPPSASSFMRSTEKVTERLTDIPVDLRKLWNPDECPADLLPYLAWIPERRLFVLEGDVPQKVDGIGFCIEMAPQTGATPSCTATCGVSSPHSER